MLGIVIIAIFVGAVAPALGGLACSLFKGMSIKTESSMLSFAAGVMLSIVCFDLIPEAFLPDNAEEPISMWFVILSIFIGYSIIHLLNKFLEKKFHQKHCTCHGYPHTHDDEDEHILEEEIEHKKQHLNKNKCYQLLMAGIVMAIAISIHNFPEGIVIGASYVGNNGLLFAGSGFIIAVMVALHNIPAGVAISAPLISGGMNKIKAVLITALTGISTVIGTVIGYSLGMVSDASLSVLLGLASGTILNVIFCELLPEAIIMWRSKVTAWFVFIGMLVGIVLINAGA